LRLEESANRRVVPCLSWLETLTLRHSRDLDVKTLDSESLDLQALGP
jgi:hypothetical protein